MEEIISGDGKKKYMWIITIIYWLQAFAAPVILFGLAGIASGKNIETVIVLAAIGVVAGIVLAEYIRRKYGLGNFFSRIYGPNRMDEIIKEDAEKKRNKDHNTV